MDPWQEDAHRRVMRVLAVMGQRSAALRLLSDGLGVEPEAETTELYARLQRGEKLETRRAL